jgi:hypothetical protein
MTEGGKPWRWPGVWVRQESFWRDVGSRTLSAVFAAAIVYVFAIVAGYVSKPDVWPTILLLSGIVAYASLNLLTLRRGRRRWANNRREWARVSVRAQIEGVDDDEEFQRLAAEQEKLLSRSDWLLWASLFARR